ncbi:hypothetical protein M422DRAFT_246755 [Sphaerobolus stellatus SS14]|nr:hypothetical protein M422DRAFT_246755 [Sphaerobolus stellatus SS14]
MLIRDGRIRKLYKKEERRLERHRSFPHPLSIHHFPHPVHPRPLSLTAVDIHHHRPSLAAFDFNTAVHSSTPSSIRDSSLSIKVVPAYTLISRVRRRLLHCPCMTPCVPLSQEALRYGPICFALWPQNEVGDTILRLFRHARLDGCSSLVPAVHLHEDACEDCKWGWDEALQLEVTWKRSIP